jgi:hypothetical protein
MADEVVEQDQQDRNVMLVIGHGWQYTVPVGLDYRLPMMMDDNDDEEENIRRDYERWELEQGWNGSEAEWSPTEEEEGLATEGLATEGLPTKKEGTPIEEEWSPTRDPVEEVVRLGAGKENTKIIRNFKKPKEETGRERWKRVTATMGEREFKKSVRVTKKMVKQGKMKKIQSYFNKVVPGDSK